MWALGLKEVWLCAVWALSLKLPHDAYLVLKVDVRDGPEDGQRRTDGCYVVCVHLVTMLRGKLHIGRGVICSTYLRVHVRSVRTEIIQQRLRGYVDDRNEVLRDLADILVLLHRLIHAEKPRPK